MGKRAWIQLHLGDAWVLPEKFICVKDKTTVPGTLLIDDKPEPTKHWRFGEGATPSWQHVVFTQPFNIDLPECEGKPRLEEWALWEEVIIPLLDERRGQTESPG